MVRPKSMKKHQSKNRLARLKASDTPALEPRLPTQIKKEYQRALFQAALRGNITTLKALTEHHETSSLLIDEEACDNALWVSIAEDHDDFAIELLKSPATRNKISPAGAKEAISLSNQHQKSLIQELLCFLASSTNERAPRNP